MRIYLVEAQEAEQQVTADLIRTITTDVVDVESAEDFMDVYDLRPAVLVAALNLPGMSGIDLIDHLASRGIFIPAIVTMPLPSVPLAISAVKKGAHTVLVKPISAADLWTAVHDAFAGYDEARSRNDAYVDAKTRLESLTESESAVLTMILHGEQNKSIARSLGVSVRTVESRRRSIRDKLDVDSDAEMIQKTILARR